MQVIVLLIFVAILAAIAVYMGYLNRDVVKTEEKIPADVNFDDKATDVAKPKICSRCSTQLSEEQLYCPKCGKKYNSSAKVPKLAIAISVLAVVLVAGLIIAALSSQFAVEDFNSMYGDLDGEIWCDIGEDGSWIKIDTNPYDIEDYFSFEADTKIENVLSDLGFPSYVFKEMGSTRALDGRQTAETDKYEVSWSYHPDNGLEVIFKIK